MNALEIVDATVEGRLEHVSLAVPRASLVGLVGPNGSGKSSLLQFAAGLLPGAGAVRWADRPLEKIPTLERGRRAAWVPQEAHFEFAFSVRSVVAQGRFAHGDDEQGVDEALERFDLMALAQRPVTRLSGGERQRVLLARAVVTQAPLQLWDEPLAALDVRHALNALQFATALKREGVAVVFSLHDLRLAHCLDAVAVMHGGRLRAFGPPLAVLTPELLLDVFGVRARSGPGLNLELP